MPEPARDRRGWRYFSQEHAQLVVAYAQTREDINPILNTEMCSLRTIDWDFTGAKTSYLTHGLHPYPAKFIPQIPNALIQELSSVGDTVGDIFCGSGTTLVEALALKRHAVGIDANPLACLISRAKTATVGEGEADLLLALVAKARALSDELRCEEIPRLFPTQGLRSKGWRPDVANLNFWFMPHVIEELAEVLSWCKQIPDNSARYIALSAFSAIVVAVSNQDSDTRYVRREKGVAPGDTARRFARSLEATLSACVEFTDLREERFQGTVVERSLLEAPNIPVMDLMICSPPYPNAFSYHLYHMTRMLWLGMDQARFKHQEIGSHRKYSSKGKNAATVETFREEFTSIMKWLKNHIKTGGYACFVVGDSTLKGVRINNAELISEAGRQAGFREATRIERTMQATKKSFNPAIGRIKTETILIMQAAS